MRSLYLAALALDSVVQNQQYRLLPLHCTLLPCFATEASIDAISKTISRVVSRVRPVRLVSKRAELLGDPPIKTPVFLVEPCDALMQLHHRLCEALEGHDIRFAHAEHVLRGYLPHVSNVEGRAFPTGSAQTVDRAYVVRISGAAGAMKGTVASVFPLTGKK